MQLISIKSIDVFGKRILLRVDWNVPLHDGQVGDDFRIQASLPTIKDLIDRRAAHITILSHLGNPVIRPGESLERTMEGNKSLSLAPVAAKVFERLKLPEKPLAVEPIEGSPLPGYNLSEQLTLLENVRFASGETSRDPDYVAALAGLGDLYVNEAFSTAHRTDASLVELPKHLPHYAGLRLEAEVETLGQLLAEPPQPFVVVLGGAKIADKAPMISALLEKVDYFLVGGVMANTFLVANGVDLKQSLVEKDRLSLAKELFARSPKKFVLPLDFVWERDRVLDIGPQTAKLFERYIDRSATIFWNGPLGWTGSGKERFFKASQQIARAIAASDARSIIAGGETLEVVDRYHLGSKFSFLSTGGGATLAFLAGEKLPGLEALAA